jgi:hypothetical protein
VPVGYIGLSHLEYLCCSIGKLEARFTASIRACVVSLFCDHCWHLALTSASHFLIRKKQRYYACADVVQMLQVVLSVLLWSNTSCSKPQHSDNNCCGVQYSSFAVDHRAILIPRPSPSSPRPSYTPIPHPSSSKRMPGRVAKRQQWGQL